MPKQGLTNKRILFARLESEIWSKTAALTKLQKIFNYAANVISG